MRISDWSSDVCSSDLAGGAAQRRPAEPGSMPRPGRRCVRSPRTDRPRRVATIPAWRCRFRASGTSGACLRHSGKLARFVPTFLTDAAETPRKNLRLDRHGDPWVAVHPVRLLRHGAVPIPAEPYVLGQGRGTAEVVEVRAVVVAGERKSEEHTSELQSIMRN